MKKCPSCGSIDNDANVSCGVCAHDLSAVPPLNSSEALDDAGTWSQDDAAILEVAKAVLRNLRVHRPNAQLVVWNPGFPVARPWFLRRGRLGLSAKLKGKLTPEEWRPLLAASIIYDTRLRFRSLVGGLVFLTMSLVVLGVFGWYYFHIIPQIPNCSSACSRGYGNGFILFIFGDLSFFAAVMAPYMKRLKLRADRLASEELAIGTELVEVLRKIDSLSLGQGRGKYWNLVMWSPTVPDRMRSLQGTNRSAIARLVLVLCQPFRKLPVPHPDPSSYGHLSQLS